MDYLKEVPSIDELWRQAGFGGKTRGSETVASLEPVTSQTERSSEALERFQLDEVLRLSTPGPPFVPQSSAAPSTEQVLGKRREPLNETQLETLYGSAAANMMRKMGGFDDRIFEDPKRQLIQEGKRTLICTVDEFATMPSQKKAKREGDPPVDYGQWNCHRCGVRYDGGPGWEKTRSKKWYCPDCPLEKRV
jgi:hypothetical protein